MFVFVCVVYYSCKVHWTIEILRTWNQYYYYYYFKQMALHLFVLIIYISRYLTHEASWQCSYTICFIWYTYISDTFPFEHVSFLNPCSQKICLVNHLWELHLLWATPWYIHAHSSCSVTNWFYPDAWIWAHHDTNVKYYRYNILNLKQKTL